MPKHTGRGIAAIEYPTGMNQNGDPSQAWIKVKPDGRVDVFAGTSDIGNGSKTIQSQIVAETMAISWAKPGLMPDPNIVAPPLSHAAAIRSRPSPRWWPRSSRARPART